MFSHNSLFTHNSARPASSTKYPVPEKWNVQFSCLAIRYSTHMFLIRKTAIVPHCLDCFLFFIFSFSCFILFSTFLYWHPSSTLIKLNVGFCILVSSSGWLWSSDRCLPEAFKDKRTKHLTFRLSPISFHANRIVLSTISINIEKMSWSILYKKTGNPL